MLYTASAAKFKRARTEQGRKRYNLIVYVFIFCTNTVPFIIDVKGREK